MSKDHGFVGMTPASEARMESARESVRVNRELHNQRVVARWMADNGMALLAERFAPPARNNSKSWEFKPVDNNGLNKPVSGGTVVWPKDNGIRNASAAKTKLSAKAARKASKGKKAVAQ